MEEGRVAQLLEVFGRDLEGGRFWSLGCRLACYHHSKTCSPPAPPPEHFQGRRDSSPFSVVTARSNTSNDDAHLAIEDADEPQRESQAGRGQAKCADASERDGCAQEHEQWGPSEQRNEVVANQAPAGPEACQPARECRPSSGQDRQTAAHSRKRTRSSSR
jgi:hypothetical protein